MGVVKKFNTRKSNIKTIDMEVQTKLLMHAVVQANSGYTTRRETVDGSPYMVVPVTMMVEGVHNGNQGPLYHPAEELAAAVAAWANAPITISHPQDGEEFVSVTAPGIAEQYVVGEIRNPRMEGERLRAEAWVNENELKEKSPEAHTIIENGEPLEVSTGLFSTEESVTGEWNGETYNAISRSHVPDHLALLPGEVGACSYDDGCGIRANQKGGLSKPMKEKNGTNSVDTDKKQYLTDLIANAESGYREIMSLIQSKLDVMDTDLKTYYTEDVFDDYFVYTVRSRESGTPPKLYKRGYSVNDSGTVEFAEESVEVRKQVTYATFAEGGMRRTKFNNNSKKEVTKMSDKSKVPCCEDAVDALIANVATKFTDEDKPWLLTLEEDQVAKLVQNAVQEIKEEVKKDPPKDEVAPQLNEEQVKTIVKETFKTNEAFMELAPDELREQLRSGLKLHQEHRAKMAKAILDNTENVWEEDNLKGMEIETLEKLFKSVASTTVADYSINGVETISVSTAGEEPLMPPFQKKVAETV